MSRATLRNCVPRTKVAASVATALIGAVLARMAVTQRPALADPKTGPVELAKFGLSIGDAGCAFGDSRSYCAMALGHLGRRPFSDRPLVPFLVRALRAIIGGSLLRGFEFVSVSGFVLTAVALGALAYTISTRVGAEPRALVAAVAVGLWVVTPFALRFSLAAPVLTDAAGTGLTVAWLALFFAQSDRWNPWARPLTVAVAVAAVLTREAAFATILATCVVAVAVRMVSFRVALVTAAAAVSALLFDLSRPSRASNISLTSTWSSLVRFLLHHPDRWFAALFMGVGFALIAVLPTALWRLARALDEPRALIAVVPAATVPLVLSTFAALDIARVSSAAAPVACLLLALYLLVLRGAARALLVTCAALVVVHRWNLLGTLGRTPSAYIHYFEGSPYRAGEVFVFVVLAVFVVGLDAWELRAIALPGKDGPG